MLSDGGNEHVQSEDEFRTRDWKGATSAAAVEVPQFVTQELDSGHLLALPQDPSRVGQEVELDTLSFCSFDFFLVSGHFLASAAID